MAQASIHSIAYFIKFLEKFVNFHAIPTKHGKNCECQLTPIDFHELMVHTVYKIYSFNRKQSNIYIEMYVTVTNWYAGRF